ncbi:mycofactocin precursor MftA [Hoyosella subflava]|nr:mycofactocin precursor MftA [Hoyosella subflava]
MSSAPENSVTETGSDVLASEDLVEDVSIDGMCGVY